MKWYKHDPAAFLEGVIGLDAEERGFYITVISLLYARDGIDVRDHLVCRAMACHGRSWNAVKRRLIAKGKLWVQADGSLMVKRVENALKEARNFAETQAKRARKRWERTVVDNENNGLEMPLANMPTTTTTTTTKYMPRKRGRPKVTLPENWHPMEDLSPDDLLELERFKNHARANDRRCADWLAAWRNWKTSPYRRPRGTDRKIANERHSISAAFDRLFEQLEGGVEASGVPREANLRMLPDGSSGRS